MMTTVEEEEELDCAKTIWSYMRLGMAVPASDLALIMGSNDLRVADAGADLLLDRTAQRCVISGGGGHADDLLATQWRRSEAEEFANVLADRGGTSRRHHARDRCNEHQGERAVH